LTARLRALVRRGKADRPDRLAAGDLTLDLVEHTCRRGDEKIALTPREFSILEYLLRRVGEVVPKAEILSQVWDFAFSGDPNIVEVNIANLRKKVDAPFDRHAIETVRGVGYRLAADGG
jgi:DNA-binding response OmpR family regulator